MAIHVQHTYSTHVEVTFDNRFRYAACGSMDEILEAVCDALVHHDFTNADVNDIETGELLMVVNRT